MPFHNLLPTLTRVPPTKALKQNVQLFTSATCIDKARRKYWKKNVNDTQNKVSLAAEFQLSSRPHNMLRKLALKAHGKIHFVGPKINNTTAGIRRNLDTGYCVQNALVQQVVKNSFLGSSCTEQLRYRIHSPYVNII